MNKTLIAGMLTGLVAGALLVVACSDDSPGDADAATCDCPVSEPPLTGRIVSVRAQGNIDAASIGGAAATCPAGATILGGGCEIMTADPRISLSEARILRTGGQAYSCSWSALNATANNFGFAEAICLVPAQ